MQKASTFMMTLSIGLLFAVDVSFGSAKSRFSQISVLLSDGRNFEYSHDKKTNALTLEFSDTTTEELESLTRYDERLVRRATFATNSNKLTVVKFYLRDANVRVIVNQFKEPNRVVIDFFDKDFKQQTDPTSKLPLNQSTQTDVILKLDAPASAEPREGGAVPDPLVNDDVSDRKRQLIAPLPSKEGLPLQDVAAASDGLSRGWSEYPIYIYRLNLSMYEEDQNMRSDTELKSIETLDAEKLGAYAGSLYNLGHEAKALVAYQRVLNKDSSVFDRQPLHIWKLAEIHFAQGNFGLANGYYDSVIDKHPNHILSKHAQLRKIDVEILMTNGEVSREQRKGFVTKLRKINARDNQELISKILIREAFINDPAVKLGFDKGKLPNVQEELINSLRNSSSRLETLRTSFLSATLINDFLTRKQTPWSKQTGVSLADYFAKFKGSAFEPYRNRLSDQAKERLTHELSSLYDKSAFAIVAQVYDDLPPALKSIRKVPDVAFVVADSYRRIGQKDQSFNLYESATQSGKGPTKFKAHFYRAMIASENKRREDARREDAAMQKAWDVLSEKERNALRVSLKESMESVLVSQYSLRTPLKIILSNYKASLTKDLAKQSTTAGQDANDWVGNFSPSGATVRLIATLGKRFAELGMTQERREALMILRDIKPSSLGSDRESAKEWARQLTVLADDLRNANEYLEAGRLYTLIGSEESAVENRAEQLYKGGLLLFRAGKREEAIEAFKKAKADGNNLFYSSLAGERLSQLELQN